MKAYIAIFMLSLLFAGGQEPKINQIQVIGTHNSYHKVSKFVSQYKEYFSAFELLDYELPPLKTQLDNGIRCFELDLHYHKEKGWLVLHVPKLDEESHCKTLKDCLFEFKSWSDACPKHLPIWIILDLTNEYIKWEGFKLPEINELNELESLILDVFGIDKIITPDLIRGSYETLEEAVLNNNWAPISSARGKFLFIFHNKGRLRKIYTGGDKSLKGRLMFVNSDEGEGYSATMIKVNPSENKIPEWVKKGYIVITFGCDPKLTSSSNCSEQDAKAFASGAQVIMTDYPPGSPHPQTDYYLLLPEGKTYRWNPINCPYNESPLSE